MLASCTLENYFKEYMRKHSEFSCPVLATVDVSGCCLYSCDLFCFGKPPSMLPSVSEKGSLPLWKLPLLLYSWLHVLSPSPGSWCQRGRGGCWLPVLSPFRGSELHTRYLRLSHNSSPKEGLLSLITWPSPCSSIHFVSVPLPHSLNNR